MNLKYLQEVIFPKLTTIFGQDLGNWLALFDDVIKKRGIRVEIEKAILCPCQEPPIEGGFGYADIFCECKGLGYLYSKFQYENEEEIRVFIWNINKNRAELQNLKILNEEGTLYATLPSFIPIDLYDRYKFIDLKVPISEIKKGILIEENKFSDDIKEFVFNLNKNFNLNIKSGFIFKPSHQVFIFYNIFIKDKSISRKNVFALYDRKYRENQYIKNSFIYISKDNDLIFIPSIILLENKIYNLKNPFVSLRYEGTPYYYIIDIRREYRGTPLKFNLPKEFWFSLPKLVILKRADYLSISKTTKEIKIDKIENIEKPENLEFLSVNDNQIKNSENNITDFPIKIFEK